MACARASSLLVAGGRRSALDSRPRCGVEASASRWRMDLGAPRGRAVKTGPVWRRLFAGGIVLVNPSAGVTATVPLGDLYLDPTGAPVSSAVLRPPHRRLLRPR